MAAKRRIIQRIVDKNKDGVDDRLYIITNLCAVVLPFTTIDQLYLIYVQGQAQGVSVITWFLYGALSIPLFLYSVQKKDMPMAILNGLWVIVDWSVWIGALLYK